MTILRFTGHSNQIGFDSTGEQLPPGIDSYPTTFTQNAYGIATITAVGAGGTYVQTLSYDGSGNLTGVSAWVKQ